MLVVGWLSGRCLLSDMCCVFLLFGVCWLLRAVGISLFLVQCVLLDG